MHAYQTWDHNPDRVYSRPIQYDPRSTSPLMTRERRGISTITPQDSPYGFHPQIHTTQTRQGYTHSQYYKESPRKPVSSYPNFDNHPQHYNRNQRSNYSQTWSKIQALLNKPVNYPQQISYNSFGYKERRQTAENNFGIKIDNQANSLRENYHKYFTREEGLVLKDARHYSNAKILSTKQYQELKNNGLLQQCKSEEIKKVQRTTSRIEYIPYYRKIYEYEPRQVVDYIYVPIQRTAVDEYTVEHVVDYEKREYFETVNEMVPEQRTRMRIQYIPIEQHIMYIPEESLDSFKHRMKTSNIATSKIASQQQVSGTETIQGYRDSYHISSNAISNRLQSGTVQPYATQNSGKVISSNGQIGSEKVTVQAVNQLGSREKFMSNQQIYRNSQQNYNQIRQMSSQLSEKDHYMIQPPSFNTGFPEQYSQGIEQQRKQLNQVQSYQELADRISSPGKTSSPDKGSEHKIRETQ